MKRWLGRGATSGDDRHVRIFNHGSLQILGTIGRNRRYLEHFYHLHAIAADSKGSIYAGENRDKRVQKFLFKGFSSTPNN
jgi:hypothetical protein